MYDDRLLSRAADTTAVHIGRGATRQAPPFSPPILPRVRVWSYGPDISGSVARDDCNEYTT